MLLRAGLYLLSHFTLYDMYPKIIASGILCLGFTLVQGQILTLPDAAERSVQNYHKIKAKKSLTDASSENISFRKSMYLPDVTAMVQQSFGSVNAQNGPMYAYGGLGVASTSMPLAEQNWNSAFGSLYLANINWNVFTFGRLKSELSAARAGYQVQVSDLDQEIFQHQIKVGAAYLNLVASQRLRYVQERNLFRAQVFYDMTESRANSGLIPEVDASLAKAEVSNARSAQIKAYDKVLAYSTDLAVLMGEPFQHYSIDSLYYTSEPPAAMVSGLSAGQHPVLLLQQHKINESVEQEKVALATKRPSLSAFGVIQGRGTGFDWNYVQDNTAYSSSYWKGAGIDRTNYIIGFNLSWNISNIFRNDHKQKQQQYLTQAFRHDYARMNEELLAQEALANAQYENARDNLKETKIQLESATLAYQQHSALYENGLTTLIDFTQALYALNRAEIEYEIAKNNIWQALLLQSAANGDLHMFLYSRSK